MSDEGKAKLYYGYEIDLKETKNKLSKDIEELNEELGVTIEKLDQEEKSALLVFGKEVETAPHGEAREITASNLLQYITSVAKTDKLHNTLEKLNIDENEPKLILCSDL